MNSNDSTPSLSARQHLVYICSRFLAYSVPVLFFLVTSSFYLKTYDSAQVKITFTQIGVTGIFFVWMTKILLSGELPFSKSDWVFVAPFFAFLASALISYAHTPFKAWSFEETLRRVFYMVISLVVIAEFRSTERMNRLWRWLMAAAWLALGYGIVQYIDSRFFPAPALGIDRFIWRQAFSARVFSTFGNPNFYGNFLVIVTPLILASVLRSKGSLLRPFVMIAMTLPILLLTDMMKLGKFMDIDPSFSVVVSAVIVFLLIGFLVAAFWRVGGGLVLPSYLILFAFLIANLYSTETKGAWIGFVVAFSATLLLIIEYFLHLDERTVGPKVYRWIWITIGVVLVVAVGLMFYSFVLPVIRGTSRFTGEPVLIIPTVLAAVVAVITILLMSKQPWNLKKIVYGGLVCFVVVLGGGVIQFTKARPMSVSFRLFTWISTWEMVRTSPIVGNGVGTFKVIYPAYRRPNIIVLEGKSNTETDHSEDEYIETWQDEGILGFGVLLWMIVTALTCGLKQLSWYARLKSGDFVKKRALMDIENEPRSFEVLAVTGAYIGALAHWAFDVSIRFVSSGVFSGLLPGLLVAYSRNHASPILREVRLGYDRWIRFMVAAFWTGIMLFLQMDLVPDMFVDNGDTSTFQIVLFTVLAGAAMWVLLEALEWGYAAETDVPYSEQYPTELPQMMPFRYAGVAVLAVVTALAFNLFGNYFQADVHHNLAIFFSKQAIWEKSPKYTAQVSALPQDIQKFYREWGGALEHYAEVEKDNPAFPMARYFTGNVHNDRGSEIIVQAFQALQRARQAGVTTPQGQREMSEANRLRENAFQEWDMAEKAYDRTKKLAPNYVQTHHQVGLLYVKRGDAAHQFGDDAASHEYFEKALHHFMLYRDLDPVFPPNCDRICQILMMDGKYKEAEDIYQTAIYYNDKVAHEIIPDVADRANQLEISLARTYLTEAQSLSPHPFDPKLPQIDEALKYFKMATVAEPKNVDGWKGVGLIYERTGEAQKAQDAYREALKVSPNDPDLKRSVPH